MPNWLIDPPFTLYVALGAIGLLAFAGAFFLVGGKRPRRDRKQPESSPRKYFIAAGVIAFILLGILKMVDVAFESDREQIERRLNEMSAGVREHNLDKVFRHISESFKYGSGGKGQLRSAADHALQSEDVTEIPIWNLSVEPIAPGASSAFARFFFKAKGKAFRDDAQFICKAFFVKEANGEWMLQSFQVFIFTNEKDALPIPGL